MMSPVVLAWIVLGLVTTVVAVAVCVAGSLPAATELPPIDDPAAVDATLTVLFVAADEGTVTVDGLLEVDGSPIGIPTTWSFLTPDDALFRAGAISLLGRWRDEGAEVEADLSNTVARPPSVALRCAGSRLRLPLVPQR
jgi:hypothetical protein